MPSAEAKPFDRATYCTEHAWHPNLPNIRGQFARRAAVPRIALSFTSRAANFATHCIDVDSPRAFDKCFLSCGAGGDGFTNTRNRRNPVLRWFV